MNARKNKTLWEAIGHYLVFFCVVAFVITCCLMLFVSVLSQRLDLILTDENLGMAAKLTFVNVLFISLIFTVIDAIRRKITVDRPVDRIAAAAERIAKGDFSVRLPHVTKFGSYKKFNYIVDCFNKMAEELSGVETLRTDFIANVSHELKTPLAVMKSYAMLMKSPDLDEKTRREYSDAITDAADRLSDMMTNILKLNRLENQSIYPSAAPFDLGEQLCECLLAYESVWERKKIELETDVMEGVTVNADRELLSLVWSNLFSNAFKFTDKGGRVYLRLTATDTHASVTVSDTGCGMSSEVGAHIFEKFYQGDTSHKTEGNGLGLALVKRIIDITGAEISVESVRGIGTAFTVKIARA